MTFFIQPRAVFYKPLAILALLLLTGCTSQWTFPPMAVPLQPTLQQEVHLARIDQLLARNDLSDDARAQLHYERGLMHDSLGMRDLARLDFNQSLSLKPDQPDVFNILGVYFTQNGHYDAAYEAFDSTLELDNSHSYAARNRGIALYYGGRYRLAHQDLLHHYQEDRDDPYRLIWLYLVERDWKGETKAQQALATRKANAEASGWGWQLVDMYLGKLSERELLEQLASQGEDNELLAERLCEAYFYLAKRYQFQGDNDRAVALYKLAMSGNVYEFVEHRYALLELNRLAYRRP
ncbi:MULTISPECIES: lipoprotein NlpI [Salinivibrio]|uniref:Lipoprotein NlpI n=1 Tax=Salinivibrio siamensis TaxID=414286 RepID=A0ABX3K6I8_9GAMM|nr:MULTISPECIES: lipoprotein NlpI [Salinivibrio]KKA44316.1 lipoprotein NlpI [Salinivibrio sp. KP-1]MPS33552.1 lipoprotein NlpI [Salinivibrio sp. VYel7]MPX91229.1 lipoprotein NlpI [Salinivibrio sp. VYel1]MPX94935.1 lipoprotein NlpI [Salinivibrio sp. VYel9]MPX97851.1 lipoprotein NlpI [Salinivibrio sp. VYel6]